MQTLNCNKPKLNEMRCLLWMDLNNNIKVGSRFVQKYLLYQFTEIFFVEEFYTY
jgi:hypothetical protein